MINKTVKKHWNKGGLVTVSWHADNPFDTGYSCRLSNNGSSSDTVNVRKVDFDKLLQNAPESDAKTNYRSELAKVADALLDLKKDGITVIWRPFHEMNGNWFWWCANNGQNPTNVKSYINLWKDMYVYFSARGLDNLIWVYSPYTRDGKLYMPAMNVFYPGDDYVDVVGLDTYTKEPGLYDSEVKELQALNKPLVISENGPTKPGMGNYDSLKALNLYKGKAAYFMTWDSWKDSPVAIIDNKNYKEMMVDKAAICID